MADKLRIYQLAKELNVDSKAILAKCKAEGLDVPNHMTTVQAGLAATIREWFSTSSVHTALETSAPVDLQKVRRRRSSTRQVAEVKTEQATAAEVEAEAAPSETATVRRVAAEGGGVAVMEAPLTQEAAEPAAAQIVEAAEAPAPTVAVPAVAAEKPPAVETPAPAVAVAAPKPKPVIVPAGPQHVPTPAQMKGPRVIRVEAADPMPMRRPSTGPRFRHTSLLNRGPVVTEPAPAVDPGKRGRSKTYQSEAPEEESAEKRKAPSRRLGRGSTAGEQLKEWRDRDLAERQERLRGATGRRAKRRASESHGSIEHRAITSAEVSEPIILKDFCAATGLSLAQLTPKFVNELKIVPNINMSLDRDIAELLADEFGIDLTIVAARSPLDDIRSDFEGRPRPNLCKRAPVVTFLGHVDHGKTSLMDAVRQTRVTEGEAGGITQHMGSYHLKRGDLAVTFLDTPGHQAFTAMRARGAQLTDVVVLVVAADDGVMPQTEEAINHAKAAKVPIVVALNKIDLPGTDPNKIYGQLAAHELVPTEWGGTVDVIRTSATKRIGIDELIEHLSTLSDLLDLKADPTIPARGRVIEAQMKTGVGVVARLLIQDGSMHNGEFMVCGPGFGKVRLIKDDQGNVLKEAGPSMPVEVSGLDELPSAGDEFYLVESLRRAEEIAEEAKLQRRRSSLSTFSKPKTLEELFGRRKAGETPELNVIVKADAQGSVDVLRKTLMEFPSTEVKLNILHAGVGAIVESDVLLGAASGAIVIGFHVVPDSSVKRMAEDQGVDIRVYRVIYHLMDDIKKALEGLLAPEEKVEERGSAEVRNTFRFGKIGTVAGCFVRDGVISRNHKVRVVRDGVIIRDGADIHSLRRFKDDTREVKAGFECGLKIEGFDDVKPGDAIQAYEIVKIARSL